MKILQIFGAVIAIHVVAFLLIFATPGCSTQRNIPTPDATAPSSAGVASAPASSPVIYTPTPIDLPAATAPAPTPGRAEPTRPGSPNAAALTPEKPAESVAPVSTYTVGRGDSLWSIAKKHKMTVAELAKANNLPTGATLQPGKKLIIPGGKALPAPAAAPKDLATAPAESAKPARAESGEYTVQSGESLGTIARKFQITVGELVAANSISDPAKVRAGQKLIIPGAKGAAAAKKPAVTPKSNGTAAKSATAASTPAATETVPAAAPKFEIAPPPPGQDLDAGLKDTATDVPVLKVEEPKPKG